MGHMLNNTIQDVLIEEPTKGFNACWVPDHASIATEAKVVAKLKPKESIKMI
jgi:valyl-tRNA synthetase